MKISRRFIALCALPLGLCGAAIAQQTITFSNTTPPVAVTLTPSSTVGIAANGNLTASCVLQSGDAGRCQGMPEGSAGSDIVPPIVNIAPSYSTTPDLNGAYTAGTVVTFTIGITQAPAEICRQVLVAGGTGTGWGSTMLPPITTAQATLAAASTTYSFKLRCWAATGVGDSNVVTVTTQNIPPPPPEGQCDATMQAAADASHNGYTRMTAPTRFPEMRTFFNLACGDFPATGSNVCLMLDTRNQYISLQFVAPVNLELYPSGKVIQWQSAQQGAQADEPSTYFTISQCQGDFRIPTPGAAGNIAPVGDPTLAHGCRNIRFLSQTGLPSQGIGIAYNLTGVSSASSCGLTPGNTYFFNMILADPIGGIQPGEHTCANSSSNSCGMQVRAQ